MPNYPLSYYPSHEIRLYIGQFTMIVPNYYMVPRRILTLVPELNTLLPHIQFNIIQSLIFNKKDHQIIFKGNVIIWRSLKVEHLYKLRMLRLKNSDSQK